MSGLLPPSLGHLLTEGVTPLGVWDRLAPEQQESCWTVRVRERPNQTGQWVGSYSHDDAHTVAVRVRDAIPGSRVETRGPQYIVTLGPGMHPAELRALREAVGYSIEDLARHLEASRSSIMKWESGDRAIPRGVASEVEGLQDTFHDALDAALATGGETITVPRTDEESWASTGRPARWWRIIAAEVRLEHGTRITWES